MNHVFHEEPPLAAVDGPVLPVGDSHQRRPSAASLSPTSRECTPWYRYTVCSSAGGCSTLGTPVPRVLHPTALLHMMYRYQGVHSRDVGLKLAPSGVQGNLELGQAAAGLAIRGPS